MKTTHYWFIYRLILWLLFLFIAMFGGTIRGDGPVGFGEAIVKGFIFLDSLICLVLGLLSSHLGKKYHHDKIAFYSMIILSGIFLFFMGKSAYFILDDVCSDDKGHCRKYEIFLK